MRDPNQLYCPAIKPNHDEPDFSNVKEECEKAETILIRHATTVQNQEIERMLKLNEEKTVTYLRDWLACHTNLDLLDTSLSQKGQAQCEKAAKAAAQVPFTTVFISPMRRTLQTAFHIFKEHPQFKEIKFFVMPELREKLQVVADTPSLNASALMQEFKEEFGENFDYETYFPQHDKENWFFNELDQNIKELIKECSY